MDRCSICYSPIQQKRDGLRTITNDVCSFECAAVRDIFVSRDIGVLGLSFSFIAALVVSSPAAWWLFGLVAVPGSAFFLYKHYLGKKLKPVKEKEKKLREKRIDNLENEIDQDTIMVTELDLKVKRCCYQTSRLGDRYCICGRGIPQELLDLHNIQGRSSILPTEGKNRG